MEPKAVVVFDGVCNLCNSAVQVILKNDKKEYFSFTSLQGDYGQALLKREGLDSKDFDSFILVEHNQIKTASTAALHVARRMKFPYFLLFPLIVIPKFIRDAVYHFVGRNRYKWFGKRESCMIPDPKVKKRFIA